MWRARARSLFGLGKDINDGGCGGGRRFHILEGEGEEDGDHVEDGDRGLMWRARSRSLFGFGKDINVGGCGGGRRFHIVELEDGEDGDQVEDGDRALERAVISEKVHGRLGQLLGDWLL